MKLNLIQKQLNKYGTILLNSDQSIISKKDFQGIEKYLYMLPTENVVIGDAGEKNQVDVARLMTDIKKPNLVNKNISKKVINILNAKYLSCFKYLLNKKKLFIRRAQVNFMKKNSFVGYHLDVDSNPDYLVAVVLQLGNKFTGGGYKVYKKGKNPRTLMPNYMSLIISDCKIPHEVLKVKSGNRVSFVFFLSEHNGLNRRH